MAISMASVNRPIILYDTKCKFCIKQIRIIKFLDILHKFDYDSLYNYADVPVDKLSLRTFKNTYSGAEAFKHIAYKIPLLCPMGILMSIPYSMILWEKIYSIVAKNRYLIGGRCDEQNCNLKGK
jgi:predicted DCC family thiol-disulfide oxidoreductase YuxK